ERGPLHLGRRPEEEDRLLLVPGLASIVQLDLAHPLPSPLVDDHELHLLVAIVPMPRPIIERLPPIENLPRRLSHHGPGKPERDERSENYLVCQHAALIDHGSRATQSRPPGRESDSRGRGAVGAPMSRARHRARGVPAPCAANRSADSPPLPRTNSRSPAIGFVSRDRRWLSLLLVPR